MFQFRPDNKNERAEAEALMSGVMLISIVALMHEAWDEAGLP